VLGGLHHQYALVKQVEKATDFHFRGLQERR
jgi:hypothetical protein